MRTRSLLSIVVLGALLGCASQQTPAASTPAAPSTASAPAATSPSATPSRVVPNGEARVGDRTTCPISGDEFVVTADSPHLEHEGRTYYFCCAPCVETFRAAPARYIRR